MVNRAFSEAFDSEASPGLIVITSTYVRRPILAAKISYTIKAKLVQVWEYFSNGDRLQYPS